MFKAIDFCLPTRATIVPDGPDWLHEIKYDGYRLRVERDGDRVRLITRVDGISDFDALNVNPS
jgi:ATP-dependent DNA ligase